MDMRTVSALTVRVPLPLSLNMKYRDENKLPIMTSRAITTIILSNID